MAKKINIKDLIPKKPTVLDGPIRVKFKNHVYSRGVSVMGLFDTQNKTIEISLEHATKDNIQETFNHEVFHALARSLSLEQIISPDIEEILADTISKVVNENFHLIPKK